MADFPQCVLTATADKITGAVDGSGNLTADVLSRMQVTVTTNFPLGELVSLQGGLHVIGPISGFFGEDGQLRSSLDRDQVGLTVPASHEDWHVEELQLTIEFSPVTHRGVQYQVTPWVITAPAPGTTQDLSEVPRVPGARVQGIMYGPRGDSVAWVETSAGPPRLYRQRNVRTGEWYGEESDLPGGSWSGIAKPSAAVIRGDIDAVGRGDLVRTPYEHGAIGDGVNNDSAAVQGAYDWLAARGGGTLLLPRGRFYIPSNVAAELPGVSIVGYGGILGAGELAVGPAAYGAGSGGVDFSGTCIRGVVFDRSDDFGTTRQLVLRNVRGLDIVENRFMSAGRGISVEHADGNTKFHTTAMIHIVGNRFTKLAMGIYADTHEWDRLSDWTIHGNFFNYCSDTSVWIAGNDGSSVGGVDGLTFTNNTIFSLNYNSSDQPIFASKRYNMRLGQTDWLTIAHNKFFEAGLSALYLDSPRHLEIHGNHFAWPGQRAQGDCIEIRGGSPWGAIVDNTFDWWTRAAVGVYGTAAIGGLEIGANTHRWSATPDSWKGGTTLTTSNCYRNYIENTTTGNAKIKTWDMPGVFDWIRDTNRVTARDRKSDYGGVSGATRRNTTVSGPTVLFPLSDISGSTSYNGLIVMRASNASAGSNNATYILAVESGGSTVSTIAAIGKVSGSVATDPSFTWSIVGGALRATPIGSTSGQFFFDAVCVGSVTVG